jgi:general stress protein YciG
VALSKEAREFFAKHGKRGGKMRANSMTPEQRSEAARKAVQARWAKTEKRMTDSHRELDTAMRKLERAKKKKETR